MTVRTNNAISNQQQGRDLWFDTLRVVALLRVIAYHTFWWGWLSVVFPSMGVMLALAGMLMAVSLDRSRHNYWTVIGRRLRRLLLPVWMQCAMLAPVMIWHGWREKTAPRWYTVFHWVLPITNLPDSAWGYHWVGQLWYLRTYIWLLLLSPALLWVIRRWGWRGFLISMVLPLVIMASSDPAGKPTQLILALSIYGACWTLGMAHHDGWIRTLPWRLVVPVGVVLLAAGLGWGLTHPAPGSGLDLNKIPLAQALYSAGAVLLLFRAHPASSWLGRHEFAVKFVRAVNARAVTVYLWQGAAVLVADSLVGSWWVAKGMEALPLSGLLQHFAIVFLRITVPLLGVAMAVIAFGWVEDVAARRKPRIWPWPRDAAGGLYATAASTGAVNAAGVVAATREG